MTLQTSGAISLSQVQSEYGGGNPISMSEYYRSGSYVLGSGTTTTRQPTSGDAGGGLGVTNWFVNAGQNNGTYAVYWSGSSVTGFLAGNHSSPTSVTIGTITYYRGSYQAYNQYLSRYRYGIYRVITATVNLNTGVPSSGAISLTNFYGGTN